MAQSLKDRIKADAVEARKAKDRRRTTLLTMTLSEIRNHEIEKGRDATDQDVIEVVGRAIKQRKDAADQMRDGGRSELAEKEDEEARLLEAYMPEQLSEDEVRERVREIIAGGADSIGPVMGRLMPEIKGRFDGKEANRVVREELDAAGG